MAEAYIWSVWRRLASIIVWIIYHVFISFVPDRIMCIRKNLLKVAVLPYSPTISVNYN